MQTNHNSQEKYSEILLVLKSLPFHSSLFSMSFSSFIILIFGVFQVAWEPCRIYGIMQLAGRRKRSVYSETARVRDLLSGKTARIHNADDY